MLRIEYIEEGKSLVLTLPEEDITWDQALQECINFLRGVGYIIPEDIDVA